jgi:hypothetical protein
MDNIPLKYNVKNINDLQSKLRQYTLNRISESDRFLMSNTGFHDKHTLNDIPDDLIQCDDCGNIWDGFAQCQCYKDTNID